MAGFVFCAAPAQAESVSFTDSQFWRANLGWWSSTNTYFDGNLNYRIREYHSLIHVESVGNELIETEHKFYPPSDLASAYGDGNIREGEGIEVVSHTRWVVDSNSIARLTSIAPAFGPQSDMETEIVSNDTAVRRVRDPSDGSERYRMLITLHGTDRRNIAHYGLAPEEKSGLSGFALFRGRKVSDDVVKQARQSLRERHHVAAILTADDQMKPIVQRLEPSLSH